MQKNKIMTFVIVLVVVLGALFWYLNIYKKSTSDTATVVPSTEVTTTGSEVVGKAVEALPQTNPFETKVSPYDAYKNPFGN
jgi:hypothetical protein